MAEEHATWGYRRIQGALTNLGHPINASTVRNILRRHHREPAPQRRKAGMRWAQFLTRHWEVLAATDRCTVEVITWQGLVTYDVVLVMEVATRRVHMAGITPHPTSAFMPQCGCSEESEQFSTLDETSFVNKHLQVLSTNAGILLANLFQCLRLTLLHGISQALYIRRSCIRGEISGSSGFANSIRRSHETPGKCFSRRLNGGKSLSYRRLKKHCVINS
jgi:hypothetical protein